MAISAKQKAKCVTWHHETGFITWSQRKCRTTYAESAPPRPFILSLAQNVYEHCRIENAEASRKPGESSNQEERVFDYFVR